jgi:hypothetical protein
MRPLQDLIDVQDPAWPGLRSQIAQAKNACEVLDRIPSRAESVLLFLQVTTHSTLGAIAFETGGLLIDSGWIRVLGSGCDRMEGDLRSWNDTSRNRIENALIVAHDALGGVFALDGGAFGESQGSAFYFSPDCLEWEPLEHGYTGLLTFFLEGDLDGFYGEYRWPTWRTETPAIKPDQAFSHFPPLFTKEGRSPGVSRRAISAEEHFGLLRDFAAQMGR